MDGEPMSIEVGIPELAEALRKHPFAYLVAVGDQPRAHVVASSVRMSDGVIVVLDAGRRSRNAVMVNPLVMLLLPPFEPGGYSLIVDGTAELTVDSVLVTPSCAVLHRPAPEPVSVVAGEDECVADCVKIPVEQGV
jgi:hypothetical protein